jgi:uncharacterized membrane protein
LKIKSLHPLFIIDIFTGILLLGIIFIPDNVIRIVLGLPFILFFPGYTLLLAILGNRSSLDGLEVLALSVIVSIAVVGLIGLGLNFTSLGITEMPVLCSLAAFILLMSAIGLIRRIISRRTPGLFLKFSIKLPAGRLNLFTKSATSFLLAAIVIATGVLGFTAFASRSTEKYSEFYILGLNGKAYNYPAEFVMENNRVVRVDYDSGLDSISGDSGQVTLGIINRQSQRASYSVKINIDGEAADIEYSGNSVPELKPVELSPGEKWEGNIGFAPRRTGLKQKVEFLLFKDDFAVPEDTLQLWIDATGQ